VERMRAVSSQPYAAGKSGLGLARIAYEGRCLLDFYVGRLEHARGLGGLPEGGMSALPARFADRDLAIEVQESAGRGPPRLVGRSTTRARALPHAHLRPAAGEGPGDPKRIAMDFTKIRST